FASIYNHNALAYEQWLGHASEEETQRPISTWIDREKGEIWIRTKSANPSKLKARTYTCSYFARELRHRDFQVGGYLSFPVLYSVLSCSEIGSHAESEKRESCYGNKEFSYKLWEIDRALSGHLKDRGFYGVFIASKSKAK